MTGASCALGAIIVNGILCALFAETMDVFLITNAILMAILIYTFQTKRG